MLVGTTSLRGATRVRGSPGRLSLRSGALGLTSLRLPTASGSAPSLPDTAEPG